jgi:hypothetical protein
MTRGRSGPSTQSSANGVEAIVYAGPRSTTVTSAAGSRSFMK